MEPQPFLLDSEILTAAGLQASITTLLADLVRIPSRASTDSCEPVFSHVAAWLRRHDVPCTTIPGGDGRVAGISGQIGQPATGGAIVLNASADTAGFGDRAAWTRDPIGAEIVDHLLYGRGSADAKAGIAIFCHLLAAFRTRRFAGALGFVFDADEHTGQFGGLRAWLKRDQSRVAGVMIGYPGNEQIGVGARGFWRATLQVAGAAAHSGSSHGRGTNAVVKAARLVALLGELETALATSPVDTFPLPPKITVTGIHGGGEFSVVPDGCAVDVDVRLTPAFDAVAAQVHIAALLEQLDTQWPAPSASRIISRGSVPAYRLHADSPLAAALARAGERILGRRLALAVTGPSNVGNLLAQHGIPATCGFGVTYRNIHAPDECVILDSLVPTFRVYEAALQELLGRGSTAG